MKLIRKLGIRLSKSGKSYQSWGEFLCSISICGKIVEKRLSDGKKALSCGCNKSKIKEKGNNPNYKHGYKGTRLYNIWNSIKQRILNPNHKYYKDYGGRGITICPEWTDKEDGFINFRNWSLANGYSDTLVIDRMDNNKGYNPNNCRWVTVLESNRNKTNTITLEIANEIRALYATGNYIQQELSEIFSLSFQIISSIINNKTWKNKS